jgi:hypothetical protein
MPWPVRFSRGIGMRGSGSGHPPHRGLNEEEKARLEIRGGPEFREGSIGQPGLRDRCDAKGVSKAANLAQ